jgi:enoyl-CoA hydratase/carnithine racemase
MGEFQYVHVSIKDRVAVLTVDHPPVNTLDAPTFAELSAALDQALTDDRVKVIIITGTGRSFIAGADINEFRSLDGTPTLMEKIRAGHTVMNKIERSPKPVIAAINGRYCLGGGNELILACHIRIAEERAKFGQTEIKLGLIPGWGGTQRLVRLVGVGKAVELILTGDHIRADEAYRIGLVNKVVPEGEALSEALRMAKRIALLGSVAIAKALDAIYAGLDMELDAGLAYEVARFAEIAETEDMREGLTAFLEKRRPRFKDR